MEKFKKFLLENNKIIPKDYNEGFGTTYERVMLNKLLIQFQRKYGFKKVLEGPDDGMSGLKGINSLYLSQRCKKTVFMYLDKKNIEITKNFLKDKKNRLTFKYCSKETKFPIEDKSFDLVWNFCVFEHYYNSEELLKEMKRITKKYILIITQNIYNIGTPAHVIHHILKNKRWDHGNPKFMKLKSIKKILLKSKIKILCSGYVDVPPWPDTWDMPVRSLLKNFTLSFNKNWFWNLYDCKDIKKTKKLIDKYSIFEKSKAFKIIKPLFAHHIYFLGEIY